VTLYTPNVRVSVPPGEAISYTIDVINDGKEVANLNVGVTGIPQGWNYSFKWGTWNIGELAVLPEQKQTLTLKVEVPHKVKRGTYRFRVEAGNNNSLPLEVRVTDEGTYESEFIVKQANMVGHSTQNFTFNTELNNHTSDKQLYSLRADLPPGWMVTFKTSYTEATSVELQPGTSTDVNIEINPPDNIEAGTYKIPVIAGNNSTSASTILEIVIRGIYSMELTTPTGLLSTSLTAGDNKNIELLIKNAGTIKLTNIRLDDAPPLKWNVDFKPENVELMEPFPHLLYL
jgi:uncharacterized repeat protein (TIGR01451 family)